MCATVEGQMNNIASSSPMSPTTFFKAGVHTFRDLVQKLTGLNGNKEKLPVTLPTRLSSKPTHPFDPTGPHRSPFKLHERRHAMRKLEPKLGLSFLCDSPRQIHQRLNSPIMSPVTPLGSETLFVPSPGTESLASAAVLEGDKAIAKEEFLFTSVAIEYSERE